MQKYAHNNTPYIYTHTRTYAATKRTSTEHTQMQYIYVFARVYSCTQVVPDKHMSVHTNSINIANGNSYHFDRVIKN